MNNNIGDKLNGFRRDRNLTVQELAQKAGVSSGLISGLIHGYRIIGERTARRIAAALELHGEQLEDFIFLAMNGCAEKVLSVSKGYPSEILNLVAKELNALGILPEQIKQCVRKSGEVDATLYLDDAKKAYINVDIALE